MPSGIVMNGVKDALAAALEILESAQEEVIWLIPASINSLSLTLGFVEKVQGFIQRGGVSRGIVPISHSNVEEIRIFLDAGEDIRHSDNIQEVFMYVGDTRDSVSSINVGVRDYTLDTPGVCFWSQDPTYAEYLLAAFENVWSQAVPAEKRIQELQKQR